MDEMNDRLWKLSGKYAGLRSELQKPWSTPHGEDERVSQLLSVLRELDQSVTELGGLPAADLNELVSTAIIGCGFTSRVEAWYAIVAVLQIFEGHVPPPESA